MDREESYRRYHALLIERGSTETVANRLVNDSRQVDKCLDDRRCPTCFRRVSRQVDDRQVGDKPPGTQWVKYRCACGYMADRTE